MPVAGEDVPLPPVEPVAGPLCDGLDGTGPVDGDDVGALGAAVVGGDGGGTTLAVGALPDSEGLGAGVFGAGDAEGTAGPPGRSGGVEWC
ncbi:hypothetical protein ACTWJ8_03515 [Streptomyces sp. SDT5-1]